MPFTFKNRIIYLLSCAAGVSNFVDIINTPNKAYTVHSGYSVALLACQRVNKLAAHAQQHDGIDTTAVLKKNGTFFLDIPRINEN